MSDIHEYYKNKEKKLEEERILEIEKKRIARKNKLIQNIQDRGVDFQEHYSEDELLALHEFGDPRAFYQKEYSSSRNIIQTDKGITTGTDAMLSTIQQNRNDIKLAMELGGPVMRHRMIKVIKPDDGPLEKRKMIIRRFLLVLSPEYDMIKRHIIDNDLTNLAEFCKKFYRQKIKKLLVPFVHRRILEFGAEYGLYKQINDVAKALHTDTKKFLEFDKELVDAGFYDKNLMRDSHVGGIIHTSENYIYKLQSEGHISLKQSSFAREDLSKLLTQKSIINIKTGISEVLAIMSTARNSELSHDQIAGLLFENKHIYNQAVDRVLRRMKPDLSNLELMKKILDQLPNDYANIVAHVRENDLQRLSEIKLRHPRDVLITLLIRRLQERNNRLFPLHEGRQRFEVLRALKINSVILQDRILIDNQFYEEKYQRFRIHNRDQISRHKIEGILGNLTPRYRMVIKLIEKDMRKIASVCRDKDNAHIRKVLLAVINDRMKRMGEYVPIQQIAADLKISSQGYSKINAELVKAGVNGVLMPEYRNLKTIARRLGYTLDDDMQEILKAYPQINRRKKFKLDVLLAIMIHEKHKVDMRVVCGQVSSKTGNSKEALLRSVRKFMRN